MAGKSAPLTPSMRRPGPGRERFRVEHVTVELLPEAMTFCLCAGDALAPKDRRPLFTGLIKPGMAAELRDLARRIDELTGGAAGEPAESGEGEG